MVGHGLPRDRCQFGQVCGVRRAVAQGQYVDWLCTPNGWTRTTSRASSSPAYDRYDSGNKEPDRLNDADLLAPVLLNVRLSVRSFYGLQRVRAQLEEGWAHPDLALPLEQLNAVREGRRDGRR